MSDAHDQMKKALKDVVIPRLRERTFSGSFPHFRRRRPDRIDLITFQFDRYGGGFIIELGQCPPEGFTTSWGKQIPPNKVTPWDLPLTRRTSVQPRVGSGTDSWFRYDDRCAAGSFTKTAESVLPFIEQVEKMFDDFEHVQKLGETV